MTERTDIEAIAKLLSEATPGPWEWDGAQYVGHGETLPYVPQGSHLGQTLISLDDTYENSRADCALVAALLNAAPALLAELRRLRDENERTALLVAEFAQGGELLDETVGVLLDAYRHMRAAEVRR